MENQATSPSAEPQKVPSPSSKSIPLTSHLTSYFAGTCRAIVLSRLKELRVGSLKIIESRHDVHTFGKESSENHGTLKVLDETFWPRLVFQGALGLAEAFMDGSVLCNDITNVLEVLILNRDDISDYTALPALALSFISSLYRASNSLSVSRSNVSAHYDLSNEMFASFLSPDMTYSCPIWSHDDAATTSTILLEQAQIRKLRQIISEARIKSTDHILEIGTGWGSFAIEAVRRTGCSITTVTLSIEQKQEAEIRISAAGFGDKIQVLLKDYREISPLENGYDKVVSIEMLEHVGKENHAEYFACISNLLNRHHGIAVFQTSTMPEPRYEAYCRGTDFIQKHIFPGANVPSVTQIVASMHQGSKGTLILDKLENIGNHYVKALRTWRENFLQNFDNNIRPELIKTHPTMTEEEVGSFKRKWEYYFSICEAGFKTKTLGAVMFTVTREKNGQMLEIF